MEASYAVTDRKTIPKRSGQLIYRPKRLVSVEQEFKYRPIGRVVVCNDR